MDFFEWASTMSIDEVLQTVLSFIKVLAWPVVVLTGLLLFRTQLTGLFQRVESVAGPANVSATFRSDAALNREDVAEAEVEANEVAEAVVRSGSRESSGGVEGAEHEPSSGRPGVEANEAGPDQEPAMVASIRRQTLRKLQLSALKRWAEDGADVSEPRPSWRVQKYDADQLLPLVNNWTRLENDTRYIVNKLELGEASVVLRRNPNDVLALFSHLENQGYVSPETVDTARRTKRLRDELIHGRVEARGDSATDVAESIDGLRRTLRTVGLTLIGKRIADEIVHMRGGDEVQPS